MAILDKFFEADDVAAYSAPNPGTDEKVYTIPNGERWAVKVFGASSSHEQSEAELLYSDDSGVTWTNPYDATTGKVRCLHLNAGVVGVIKFEAPLVFMGVGTAVRVKFLAKNYGPTTSEIAMWINGECR